MLIYRRDYNTAPNIRNSPVIEVWWYLCKISHCNRENGLDCLGFPGWQDIHDEKRIIFQYKSLQSTLWRVYNDFVALLISFQRYGRRGVETLFESRSEMMSVMRRLRYPRSASAHRFSWCSCSVFWYVLTASSSWQTLSAGFVDSEGRNTCSSFVRVSASTTFWTVLSAVNEASTHGQHIQAYETKHWEVSYHRASPHPDCSHAPVASPVVS